jgi:hypothetical protein
MGVGVANRRRVEGAVAICGTRPRATSLQTLSLQRAPFWSRQSPRGGEAQADSSSGRDISPAAGRTRTCVQQPSEYGHGTVRTPAATRQPLSAHVTSIGRSYQPVLNRRDSGIRLRGSPTRLLGTGGNPRSGWRNIGAGSVGDGIEGSRIGLADDQVGSRFGGRPNGRIHRVDDILVSSTGQFGESSLDGTVEGRVRVDHGSKLRSWYLSVNGQR